MSQCTYYDSAVSRHRTSVESGEDRGNNTMTDNAKNDTQSLTEMNIYSHLEYLGALRAPAAHLAMHASPHSKAFNAPAFLFSMNASGMVPA
jgi:hypothetical protein